MKICAHTLVKNEERYLWYAVESIINHVDSVLIWDTGSTDRTLDIIKCLQKNYPNKVSFKEFGDVTSEDFPLVRQEMLGASNADWILILDGDEVWWEDSIKTLIEIIKKEGNSLESIVSKYYTIVGDIYHYQPESAGMYQFDGRYGHLNIRAMNRGVEGLHAAKPHGQQGYFDAEEKLIQAREASKRAHIEVPAYLHFTNMQRSSVDARVPKRAMKLKYEIGKTFPLDFYFPEAFFKPRPVFLHSPWEKMTFEYLLRASAQTPLRNFKRRFLRSKKSGY